MKNNQIKYNMQNNLTECPQCFGVKELMTPKKTIGFEYQTCSLCNSEGKINSEIAADFIFAMNEDNFETNDN